MNFFLLIRFQNIKQKDYKPNEGNFQFFFLDHTDFYIFGIGYQTHSWLISISSKENGNREVRIATIKAIFNNWVFVISTRKQKKSNNKDHFIYTIQWYCFVSQLICVIVFALLLSVCLYFICVFLRIKMFQKCFSVTKMSIYTA